MPNARQRRSTKSTTKQAAQDLATLIHEIAALRERIDLIGLQGQIAQLAARVARLEAASDK